MLGSWIKAIFLAMGWGAFMTFHVARGKHSASLSKLGAGYLAYGLSLGLLISFGWRALQMPVIFVMLPSAGYGLFLLWSARLKLPAKSQ